MLSRTRLLDQMCIGFFSGRWYWIGSEPLRLVLDWFLEPQDCYWIGFGGVQLGLVWNGFKQGSAFLFRKLTIFHKCKSISTVLMETRHPSSKVEMVYVSYVLGTTRLVFVVVGHYWIGFGEGRIGLGLVSRGRGHYWIGYTLNETQLV